MWTGAFMLGILALGLAVPAKANDLIVTPGGKGHEVVEQVVRIIQEECIFDDDRLFLRRLAFVESRDGILNDTYLPNYNGGIWKLDEDKFLATQSSTALNYLQDEISNITASDKLMNIDWPTVTWEDLRKPLFSGLGARLYLVFESRRETIPTKISDQATYWKNYYRPAGSTGDFETAAESLEKGCIGKGSDIVFVLDGSGSIGSTNFIKIKDFVVGIVSEFDIAPNMTQIGVVQYSSQVYEEFKLNTHKTKAEVISAVNNIQYRSGGTDTAAALKFLREEALSPASGATRSVPHVAVVLTDGISNNRAETIRQAELCHAASITMISIGVGNNLDEAELEAIASEPVCQHLFELEGFDDFVGLASSIQKRSCEAPIDVVPGDNGTDIDTSLPPGGDQNCKIQLPEDGVTVKITANTGSVRYYVAKNTYPSEAYYDDKTEAGTGDTAVLYLPHDVYGDSLFCNIKGDDDEDSDLDMGFKPGDKDWCKSDPCQNGGTCADTGDGYECRCAEGFEGQNCETGQGFTCAGNNPCTPENIAAERFYHAHTDPTRFIQCDEWGGCYEMDCPDGLEWDQTILTCNWPK